MNIKYEYTPEQIAEMKMSLELTPDLLITRDYDGPETPVIVLTASFGYCDYHEHYHLDKQDIKQIYRFLGEWLADHD